MRHCPIPHTMMGAVNSGTGCEPAARHGQGAAAKYGIA